MRANLLLSALALLLSGTTGQSAQLLVAWEFPKDLGTPPWHLTLVRTFQTETTQSQVRLTAVDELTCQRLAGPTYTASTWCATLPCPAGPGAYAMLLQANTLWPKAQVAASYPLKTRSAPRLPRSLWVEVIPLWCRRTMKPHQS
jgi:hypothetical protein